jgi:small-conductance mechanosensitive channel
VGVSYKSDPDHVRSLLERAAADCALVLGEPPPSVSFDDFGANALEFSVTARAVSLGGTAAAASDLRTRILKAFRAAGIEIPCAQHDVHLRDLDAVRTILNRIAEERAAAAGAAARSKGRPDLSGASPRRDSA